MFWADQAGLGRIASSLEQLADRSRARGLQPKALLKRLSETGQKFSQLSG